MLKREKLFAAIVLASSSFVAACNQTALSTPRDAALPDLVTRDLAADFGRDMAPNCDADHREIQSCDMAPSCPQSFYCECNACGCVYDCTIIV